jgi:hypothetical protein
MPQLPGMAYAFGRYGRNTTVPMLFSVFVMNPACAAYITHFGQPQQKYGVDRCLNVHDRIWIRLGNEE